MNMFEGLWDWLASTGAEMRSGYKYDIYEVDYSAADQELADEPDQEAVTASFEISIANSYQEPRFSGLDIYSVVCDHSLYGEGSIFLPSGATVSTPKITVIDAQSVKEHVGLRTNRSGCIAKRGSVTVIPKYNNIYFDFYGVPQESPSRHNLPDQVSPPVARKRAAMFNRAGVKIGDVLIDYETGEQYTITSTFPSGGLLVLYVEAI